MSPQDLIDKATIGLKKSKMELDLLKNSKDWVSKGGYAQKALIAQQEVLESVVSIIFEALRHAEGESVAS
ncbi:MAG: hypothetical protein AAB276_06920 [Pseudomonadota bacterium]